MIAMSNLAKARMTVDEFLTWAGERPGRFELVAGEPLAMSPEGVAHAEIKFAVQAALAAEVRRRALPCRMLPDGMTVRVDETTAYEPDALVYCGERLPSAAVEVPNPVIVVEVLSPSTRRVDASTRLAGYFRVPSVLHYLIVDPGQPLVVHHQRQTGGTLQTRIITDGVIALDPPGMELRLADFYAT
jgi:Uma2 family endonuclease